MRMSLIAIGLLLLTSCSRDLGRDEASQLISKHQDVAMLRERVRVSDSAIDDGLRQGLWTVADRRVQLSEKARADITEIRSENFVNFISPSTPARIDISITGIVAISKDPAISRAEFNWAYSGLTPLIKRFAKSGGAGIATLQKYDDGWRIVDLSLSTSDAPFQLSPSEIVELQHDIDAKAEAVERVRKRIRESFTSERGEYSKVFMDDSGVWGFEVTNKDVKFLSQVNGAVSPTIVVWYGKISASTAYQVGVDIQSLTPCRYASIFAKAPSSIQSGELVSLIKQKKQEWDVKYGDLPGPLTSETYCLEHGPGGFPKAPAR